MKYIYLLLLSFTTIVATAQIKNGRLQGSWVVSKVTNRDGGPLTDDNPAKYTYLKYTFSSPNKLNLTIAYYETGNEALFEIKKNYLLVESMQRGLMNSYRIEAAQDTLVLLQKGFGGFDDPTCLKYYFVPEIAYQQSLPLKPDDIYSVKGSDTTYKSSPKIYPTYKGISFQSYVYAEIHNQISMDGRKGHFVASFIVSKTGVADSLKIYEGIDDEFNTRFVEVFTQARKQWKPALLNSKPVAVQKIIELRYSTMETAPSIFITQKASAAYNNKDYQTALYYYDQSIISVPSDKENIYRRGLCRMQLGNMSGACQDWNTAKALGSAGAVDALLEKYCK